MRGPSCCWGGREVAGDSALLTRSEPPIPTYAGVTGGDTRHILSLATQASRAWFAGGKDDNIRGNMLLAPPLAASRLCCTGLSIYLACLVFLFVLYMLVISFVRVVFFVWPALFVLFIRIVLIFLVVLCAKFDLFA